LYKFVAISGLTLFVLAAYLANRAIERRDDVLRDALVKSAESNALTLAFARQCDMRVMLHNADVSDIALRLTWLDNERKKLEVEAASITKRSKELAELIDQALGNVDVTVDKSSMEAHLKQLQDNARALEEQYQDNAKALESYYEKALELNSSYHDLLSRTEKWLEGASHSKQEVSLMESVYSLELAQHLQKNLFWTLFVYAIVATAGILISVRGFSLWYSKLQRHLDTKVEQESQAFQTSRAPQQRESACEEALLPVTTTPKTGEPHVESPQ